MATEEGKIQAAGCRHAKRLGIPFIRMHMGRGAAAGWPDVQYLIPFALPVFIEYKAPGEEPTKLQADKIALLRRIGYEVHVCDSEDAARAALSQAMDAARLSRARG